ncbi:phosphotransferase [Paracoccaceae bacterium GXU_MW_L88]
MDDASAWFRGGLRKALSAAIHRADPEASITLDHVYRRAEDRVVVSGTWNGQLAVFKWYFGEEAEQTARAVHARLTALEAQFTAPHLRAVRPLALYGSVVVMERVPGETLAAHLARGDARTREAAFPQVLNWLSALTAGQRRIEPMAPRAAIRRLRQMPRPKDAQDAALFDRLRPALLDFAQDLRGFEVLRGPGHGDLSPRNLMLSEDVLTGIDFGPDTVFPLARDIAHYLIGTRLKGAAPSSAAAFAGDGDAAGWGIAPAEFEMIAASALLPESDLARTLPFFIGQSALINLTSRDRPEAVRARLRRIGEGWLKRAG